MGEWGPPDVERLLTGTAVGVLPEFDTGGADVMLATDLVRELLRDKDAASVERGR